MGVNTRRGLTVIGQNAVSLEMPDQMPVRGLSERAPTSHAVSTAPASVVTEIIPLADIDAVYDRLETLARSAAEPNVFFEPAVLKAAMEELKRTDRHFLILVHEGGDNSPLIGAMPIEIVRHRWGPFLAVTQGWNHKMGVRGTPLIVPGHAETFWREALEAIAKGPFPRMLLIHTMVADGCGMAGLKAACQAGSRHMTELDRVPYISLKTDLDGEAYLKQSMSSRRLGRTRKALADLSKMGTLESRVYRDEEEVMAAFTRFLKLEAAGWKGRERTAIMTKPDALRFFLKAISAFARRGSVQIDALELDGRPIGMSVAVMSGHTAFCWKTAYDETLAKYNPGYLTVMDVTRRIIDNPAIQDADSCTEAGHSMMESLWSEKSEAADVLIDTRPASGPSALQLAARLEKSRRAARGKAKKLYHAMRARLARRQA